MKKDCPIKNGNFKDGERQWTEEQVSRWQDKGS